MIESLNKWIEDNNLDAIFDETDNKRFTIQGKSFYLILPKRQEEVYTFCEENEKDNLLLFDNKFELILSDEELLSECDYYVFEFGGVFYYVRYDSYKQPTLNVFKYIGESTLNKYLINIPYTLVPLGIHGKMEIMNGSREYKDWCKKALYLGYEALGISEKNTLAGILQFQIACENNKIKPIIGETISIKIEDSEILYFGKCFVLNKKGWKNLLKINSEINITNNGFILIEDLLKYSEGLVFVFKWDFPLSLDIIDKFKQSFAYIYYQIDSVIWSNKKTDINYLQYLKTYREKFFNILEPILIDDSYYLDKEDFKIKKVLNTIVQPDTYQNDSKNQHFKHLSEIISNLNEIFEKEDESRITFIQKCINNTDFISRMVDFRIELGKFHLPKFTTNHIPNYPSSTDELFFFLIEKGLKDKGLSNKKEYLERLDKELDIIYRGEFVDYFLILWDVVRFCNENKILTGIGRGSAAGSLIAYLLNITRINPIEYGLLFERFLNEGRLGKALPDIDMDFTTSDRGIVKKYIEDLYGSNYFCSIGAYINTKIKSGIKDLSRIYKLPFNEVNILTSIMHLPEGKDGDFEQIFTSAVKLPLFHKFLKKNPKIINQLFYLLKSPKSFKIHPCATVIMPKYEGENIFDYLPMKKDIETGSLISEWSGEELEKAGFLKEDILGIEQLDKISFTLNLIEESLGKRIDIYNLPLDDKNVFNFFKNGWNSDVFQFGSSGLTAYCKQVKPDSLEELINMVAIFRPGPMHSGVHHKYVNIKDGIENPEYDFGCKEITKPTFGLLIFQEQMMRICSDLGGFSLKEADDIRKACGKKIYSLIQSYKDRFIKGAVNNGCSESEAEKIWDKIQAFSSYAFNKSHAAAYAMTGYISQWLKVNYPLQFWTAALQFATEEEEILKYLAEIKRTSDNIKVVPPNINTSTESFVSDFKTGQIYWSLKKINYLGDIGLEIIFHERKIRGKYFSIGDFYSRVPKAKVNKRIIINLILGGCFDEVYLITSLKDRELLIREYCQLVDLDITSISILSDSNKRFDWWWILRQKEVSGFGFVDYKELIIKHLPGQAPYFMPSSLFQHHDSIDRWISTGGIIKKFEFKKTKTGKDYAFFIIDSNDEQINVFIWDNELIDIKNKFIDTVNGDNLGKINCEGKIILFTAKVKAFGNNHSLNFLKDSVFKIL